MHSQVQSTISRSQHYVWNTIQPDWIVSGWSEMYCTSQWLSLYRKLFDVLKCWKIASWLPHTHTRWHLYLNCCTFINSWGLLSTRKSFPKNISGVNNTVISLFRFKNVFQFKLDTQSNRTNRKSNNDGDDDDKKSRTGKVKCAQHVTLTYTCYVVNRESYSMVLKCSVMIIGGSFWQLHWITGT